MNAATQKSTATIARSTCPHDCPSTCALEVELLGNGRIGRIKGAKANSYTAGVICAKVARYAERIHHPDRLMYPLARAGAKGSGRFERISWDEALDRVAEAFLAAEARHGGEAVWPYQYAGTMGLLMRFGIERLRHVRRYSGQLETICSSIARAGWLAGHGALRGADPREMAKSDLVVIWGTNPVHTQVNVMTHATRARKERGARIVAIDIYHNATMERADLALCLRPGTDAALALGVMHVLFRDGYADRAYLDKYSDRPADFEAHLADKTPAWAAAITGLGEAEIEAFARLIGETPRAFFRLGYGFTRSRNGALSMHAASCIPVVSGAWQHEGGGAFFTNGDIYGIDMTLITGSDRRDPELRMLDMSQIGRVLLGERAALKGGPPVAAMLIQSTNPAAVAPEQAKVVAGLAREDLFVCVHEQFMTETAQLADIVLPATMFLEHDDIYRGGGHQHLMLGPKLLEPPGECRNNHEVICALAERLGAEHEGFTLSPEQILDRTLRASGRGTLAELREVMWLDCQPPFEEAHFLNGFAWPDGKFRFAPDWASARAAENVALEGAHALPSSPDHWDVTEEADERHPFRLATSPARSYLNTSFVETPSSREREGPPTVLIHPDDLARLGIEDGAKVRVGNERGEIVVRARSFDGLQRGVVIVESIPPNSAFEGGRGINTLTSASPVLPVGGAAFHDNHVWIAPRSLVTGGH